ncbi:MAG: DUF1896 domain-containing protein [Cytophagaceae bacterium]|jgi:hypothetical protein|nr:DUF1896 domain-containing protein [Cytophagaceae bacterium]
MNRKNKHHAPDISCFRLSLTAFLRESHPERLRDNRFIIACTDAATEAYEQANRCKVLLLIFRNVQTS